MKYFFTLLGRSKNHWQFILLFAPKDRHLFTLIKITEKLSLFNMTEVPSFLPTDLCQLGSLRIDFYTMHVKFDL